MAHFHYVLSIGAVFSILIGTYHWIPLFSGIRYNKIISKIFSYINLCIIILISSLYYRINIIYITNHIFLTSLLISIFRGFVWWYTVQYERIYINSNITWNLKIRILLFILSELILFSRFFWGFFNSYISVEIDNRRIISVLYNYLPIIDALSVLIYMYILYSNQKWIIIYFRDN